MKSTIKSTLNGYGQFKKSASGHSRKELGASLLGALLFLAAAPAFAADSKHADFGHERFSRDAREVANWVMRAGDNRVGARPRGEENYLPFVIIDKKEARVYVFNAEGRLLGAAPVLLGIGIGDTSPPGLGQRELSNIAPKDRISPAGRFLSNIGLNHAGKDVVWIDYEDGFAMHRVSVGNPKENRIHRLATPTIQDNRISYGCVNVSVAFYEKVIQPQFNRGPGIVYVLPEKKPLRAVFALD